MGPEDGKLGIRKERVFPISPALEAGLRTPRGVNSLLLFPNRQGKMWNAATLTRVLHGNAPDQTGWMHAFRHGNVSLMDGLSVPMKVRQERVGHAAGSNLMLDTVHSCEQRRSPVGDAEDRRTFVSANNPVVVSKMRPSRSLFVYFPVKQEQHESNLSRTGKPSEDEDVRLVLELDSQSWRKNSWMFLCWDDVHTNFPGRAARRTESITRFVWCAPPHISTTGRPCVAEIASTSQLRSLQPYDDVLARNSRPGCRARVVCDRNSRCVIAARISALGTKA
jgi:hypothetical protein